MVEHTILLDKLGDYFSTTDFFSTNHFATNLLCREMFRSADLFSTKIVHDKLYTNLQNLNL